MSDPAFLPPTDNLIQFLSWSIGLLITVILAVTGAMYVLVSTYKKDTDKYIDALRTEKNEINTKLDKEKDKSGIMALDMQKTSIECTSAFNRVSEAVDGVKQSIRDMAPLFDRALRVIEEEADTRELRALQDARKDARQNAEDKQHFRAHG